MAEEKEYCIYVDDLVSQLNHLGFLTQDITRFFHITKPNLFCDCIFVKKTPEGDIEIKDKLSSLISTIEKKESLPFHIMMRIIDQQNCRKSVRKALVKKSQLSTKEKYLFCINCPPEKTVNKYIKRWLERLHKKSPLVYKFLHEIKTLDSPDSISQTEFILLTNEEYWKFSRCYLFTKFCSGYTKTIMKLKKMVETKETEESSKFDFFFKKLKYKKSGIDMVFTFLYNYNSKDEITDDDISKFKVHPSCYEEIRNLLWNVKNSPIFIRNMKKNSE